MLTNIEIYAVAIGLVGLLLVLIGYVWLVLRGVKLGWLWGVAALVPPFPLWFWLRKPKEATAPWLLILLGLGITAGSVAAGRYLHRIDLGPLEDSSTGELHLTLTGWDRDDYSVLDFKTEAVVLQMANKDVTDEVVQRLIKFDKLQELDLTDTQITDTSLAVLGQLPQLRILKVARTAISDEAFREHLLEREKLLEVDVRGTKVSRDTLRKWKKGNKERKSLPKVF